MNENKKLKRLIIAALMTALTTVGTMIIRIPTPTMGYIHPGDGFVLLSGLLLGPVWGSLAAGIGSALSDLFGGYMVYVIPTFIIKALTALVGVLVFRVISRKNTVCGLIVGGIAGEAVMVLGYFVFEIFMLAFTASGDFSASSIAAGAAASVAGIIPNIIQGVFGVIISTVLYPLLKKLSEV